MMRLCGIAKDGYWCTLPHNHSGLHCDEPMRVRFDDSWKHASGWHYPPGNTLGHAIIDCCSNYFRIPLRQGSRSE